MSAEELGNGALEMDNIEHIEEESRVISEPRRLSKAEIKRMRDREERKRRLLNKGVPQDKVDAIMAEEDFRNLSADKKCDRLHSLFATVVKGLQADIMALRHNDSVIADAMDINLKAMSMCLTKAGISSEMQESIIKEVEKEIREDQRKKAIVEAETRRKLADKMEAAKLKASASEEAPEEEELPEGATVFGS